jgi:hypothetical protein
MKTFKNDLAGLECKRKGVLSYEEFGIFLREQRFISVENMKKKKIEL